jgi:hypothetical protein
MDQWSDKYTLLRPQRSGRASAKGRPIGRALYGKVIIFTTATLSAVALWSSAIRPYVNPLSVDMSRSEQAPQPELIRGVPRRRHH